MLLPNPLIMILGVLIVIPCPTKGHMVPYFVFVGTILAYFNNMDSDEKIEMGEGI